MWLRPWKGVPLGLSLSGGVTSGHLKGCYGIKWLNDNTSNNDGGGGGIQFIEDQ